LANVHCISEARPPAAPSALQSQLAARLAGQPEAINAILPFVQMHQAGLSPEGRPIGVMLLLGPTGTGKTFTVEALAEILHGSSKNLLKVDCGEFQMEHEVAKLTGAPPGYLGHRETQPLLTQAKLSGVTSESSDISIVLFDEIEKASASMTRLLLGILDKATLHLSDNNTVNFERSLIFLTSNLGSATMQALENPGFGLAGFLPGASVSHGQRQSIGRSAVKQKFSPEFVNRIDAVVTYQPLGRAEAETILDAIVFDLTKLVTARLGLRAFRLFVTTSARRLLLEEGVSAEYGARELKRTVQKRFVTPLSALVAQGAVPPQSTVILEAKSGEFKLRVEAEACA
jgi:ATP-dependent Clp protease ATP-binding subunit ClpA